MIKTGLKKTSAIIPALFFFLLSGYSSLSALPLTETVYSIPEDQLEFFVREEVHHINNYYSMEQAGLGIGLTPSLSVWFMFDYLHLHGPQAYSQNQIGDIFLKIHSYIGDVLNDTIHFSFLVQFRFPTSKDAYADPTWRNLSFGGHEFTIGPIVKFDIIDKVFIHFNLFYTFRPAPAEDFYGGLYLDPFSASTWQNVFGLNFMSSGAFLYYERLKNDYMTVALAINTDVIYPVVPYAEFSAAFRLYRGDIVANNIMIKAAGADPAIYVSLGMKFFITRRIYIGLYAVIVPLQYQGFTRETYGLDFSVQF